MVVAGFLLGTHVLDRLAMKYADHPQTERAGYAALPIWILIGILLGARLMYVIVEILRGSDVGQEFLDSPFQILAYWRGGLVMYGGTAGGFVGALLCARKHKLRVPAAFDLGVVAAFSGLFVGRMGCLLVGDDYGSVAPASFATAPFPLVIHVPDPLPEGSLFGVENAGKVLWATQVWMSLAALWLSWIGARLLKRRRYAGQTSLVLLLMYSILRSTIEAFRGDEVRGLWFGETVSTSQLISAVLGVVCLTLLVRNRKRREVRVAGGTPGSPEAPGTTGGSGAD
jgi:phosphatidylglycerol:prolipoprotein diacylglycerol transferase